MKVLYISTNFTALSHSFITREIQGLRAVGVEVDLLSVRTTGTSPAFQPECDLAGCRFIYPAPFFQVVDGTIRTFFRSPSRFFKAVKIAFISRGDTFTQKLKLLFQMIMACRFSGWVLEEGIQHIHSHFAGPPTSFALFLSVLTGCPFTFTDHGAGIFHDRIGLETKFRRAAGISAISEFNIQFYPQVSPIVPPVKIVRCGLSLPDFTFRQRSQCGNPVKILAVSRIVPKKGFSFLLDGLAYLDKIGIAWEGAIVGEGPLVPDLKAKSEQMGLADRLEFTGPKQQEQIREMMGSSDIFVLPCVVAPDGDMDGIPVTLMEAMACGCPVISTRLSGIPELVINEKTGLLLEPGDGLAVGEAMARLVNDPRLYSQLSLGGYQWVAEEFNIKKSARRIADFFAEIADRNKDEK